MIRLQRRFPLPALLAEPPPVS